MEVPSPDSQIPCQNKLFSNQFRSIHMHFLSLILHKDKRKGIVMLILLLALAEPRISKSMHLTHPV